MANPVLVEVTRGGHVESRHRGAAAIVDARGRVRAAWGDIKTPVYPRSSIKIIQALPMMETGAADRFGFTGEMLALAVSSHAGEPAHVDTAAAMLAALELDRAALACGAHWPTDKKAAAALARAGERPCALHNNCSGKHAGMLATAIALGAPAEGYTEAAHPAQQRALGTLESLAGVDLRHAPWDRDGCSVPTWALPLENLALAFARLAVAAKGEAVDMPDARAAGARRLMEAAWAHPFLVAGSGRYCTKVLTALRGRAFVKLGAEGVYVASLPEYGLGVAVKCDDGAARAAEVAMTALLDHIGVIGPEDRAAMDPLLRPVLRNVNGHAVGEIRPAGAFTAA